MIDIARRLTETVRSEAAALGLPDAVVVPTLTHALARALAQDIGPAAGPGRVAVGIGMAKAFLSETLHADLGELKAKRR